jgi:hypothetical protein
MRAGDAAARRARPRPPAYAASATPGVAAGRRGRCTGVEQDPSKEPGRQGPSVPSAVTTGGGRAHDRAPAPPARPGDACGRRRAGSRRVEPRPASSAALLGAGGRSSHVVSGLDLGAGEGDRHELAPLVLHADVAGAHRGDVAGCTAVEVHGVGRPPAGPRARDLEQLVDVAAPGTGHERDPGGLVVGGEEVLGVGPTPSRATTTEASRAAPAPSSGVRLHGGEVADRVGAGVGATISTHSSRSCRPTAQHGVDEARARLAATRRASLHGLADGRVRRCAGNRGCWAPRRRRRAPARRPRRAGGRRMRRDRVEEAATAQRAVGEGRGGAASRPCSSASAITCGATRLA